MPVYEYNCTDCDKTFDRLRPMSKADAPAACTYCGSDATSRAISLFSAISKSNGGESRAISGTGSGCASCAATSCATCSH
jgi:putative FmdB family regulatory protein